MVSVFIPADFGLVILSAVSSMLMIFWLSWNVGHYARDTFGVKYPKMYADDDTKSGHMFNCYQRAHQNTLEGYPGFLMLLLLGGLYLPRLSAASGLLWVISRVFYARGYYTGDPSKRMHGAFGYIGFLVLLVNTCLFACNLLGYVNL